MKVSDYDRQEFAQALRELADGNGGELLDHVKCLRVDEVGDYTLFGVGAVLAMDRACLCEAEDASGYLAALADIVEWPTCRNVHGGREFECSEYGLQWHLLDRADALEEWAHVRRPKHCPNCGRRVVG